VKSESNKIKEYLKVLQHKRDVEILVKIFEQIGLLFFILAYGRMTFLSF
jgi:hypothetical protein